LGDGFADAAAGAGNKGDAVLEQHPIIMSHVRRRHAPCGAPLIQLQLTCRFLLT
jgi:hypothetical protein